MRDEGFLIFDSMLAMLVFSIITSVLLPSMIIMHQLLDTSESRLDFTRKVYLEIVSYESFEEFKDETSRYTVRGAEICRKNEPELCVQYE